ncbi:MAG: hypothetical protein LBG44_02550 [Gemmatimonadota bacterium]|jgi:hypothetical protein|nr:hypothetical protein [Gemmatimonadota bacterium]
MRFMLVLALPWLALFAIGLVIRRRLSSGVVKQKEGEARCGKTEPS